MKRNGSNNNFKSLAEKKSAQALRFFNNAKETLKKSPVEYALFKDTKYVAEACGMCYLAVVRAIESHLLRKGVSHKNLPDDAGKIRKILKGHTNGNGKILSAYNTVYETIHVLAYYQDYSGELNIRTAFEQAKYLINKFCNNKNGKK